MIASKNQNLIAALLPYQEGLDLDDEQRLEWLQDDVAGDLVNIEQLKIELSNALSDESFDWNGLAKESSLLLTPAAYDRKEIANYVKYVLNDFLYPARALSSDQIERLHRDVIAILQNGATNEGWVYSYDLFESLKKNEHNSDLEYYNLWRLDFSNSGIERKPLDGKSREIGYLNYRDD